MSETDVGVDPKIQCRLCSSKKALISMFKGQKNNEKRMIIRNLLATTVGIKVQKYDYYKCICVSCVMHIYNIHVFVTKSLENQKKLYDNLPKGTELQHSIPKLNKKEDLPTIDVLKRTFAPWIISKHGISSDSEESDHTDTSYPSSSSNGNQDKSTQTTSLTSLHVYCQTDNKGIDAEVQTKTSRNISNSTQCDILKPNEIKTKNISNSTQCDLLQPNEIKTKYRNKSSQTTDLKCKTELIVKNLDTVDDKDLQGSKLKIDTKDLDIVNDEVYVKPEHTKKCPFKIKLKSKSQKPPLKSKIENNNYTKETAETSQNSSTNKNNGSKLQLDSKSTDIPLKVEVFKSRSEQPVLNVGATVLKDNSYPKKTLQIINMFDDDEDEYAKCKINKESANKQVIVNLTNTKETINSNLEENTDLNIQLNCNSNSKPQDIVQETSDINALENNEIIYEVCSPRSSKLLKISEKVDYLKTCIHCGIITYTKSELLEHRKTHLQCSLCKKKFRSLTKTKEHFNSNCMRRLICEVNLVRIDDCEDLKAQYPAVLEQLNSVRKRPMENKLKQLSSKKPRQ